MASNSNHSEPREIPDGVYAAALTPIRPDLSCDHEALIRHCFDLVQRGCRGVVLFGTTGEGASFTAAEKIEVLDRLLVEGGFDPKKVMLGNGSGAILETVELAKDVLKRGCLALLIAPPSFYKNITDEGIIAYYREVIQRVDDPNLRIILYHIPHLSGVGISLKVIETLRREFPKIVIGLKESEGDFPFTKSILTTFPGFRVFVGNALQLIESVNLGGSGAICGVSNIYPELVSTLFKLGKQACCRNPQEIEAIFRALKGLPFVPAIKALMEKRHGEAWHCVRPPLVCLTNLQVEQLVSVLNDAKEQLNKENSQVNNHV